MSFHWNQLERPILALAPMSGYTGSAFRRLIKEINHRVICFTEFISANGINYGNIRSARRFNFAEEEQPLIVQIFGHDPLLLARAAAEVERAGAAGIDINMGCPARKVLRSGSGASLVKDWSTARDIVVAVKRATSLPVSVKTRIGWDDGEDAIEFAEMLAASGTDMLTVHGRTVAQGHLGEVNWETIYQIKSKLKVPVLGNGGISSSDDAEKRLGNLDGIMIGRAALINPWIFVGLDRDELSLEERFEWIVRHARLAFELNGRHGIVDLRKHLMHYISGLSGAAATRRQLSQAETVTEVSDILADWYARLASAGKLADGKTFKDVQKDMVVCA